MSEWQPIETASKTEAMLMYFPNMKSGRTMLGDMMKVARLCDVSIRQPTHWMPLPEPPK